MTQKRTLLSALLLLVTVAVGSFALTGCGGTDTQDASAGATAAGDAADSSPIIREDFALENFRGRPVLLNFWATW